VFGDVNSSLAGAIAAAKLGIPVIHVEAGLRSDDARMPEETNRILIDHLSERLMVSEPAATAHLNEEGISEGIYSVGSLMAQSIELFKDLIDSDAVCDKFSLERKGFLVATIHRIENIEDPAAARKVLDVLGALSKRHTIVFPLHPGTRRRINELGISDVLGAVRVIEPLGYLEFLGLVTGSRGVITDSGGIQEETTHLGIPCATLRDNTERPVTVERGTNRLFPPSTLTEDTYESIEGHLTRTDFKSKQIPLWDAHVAERIFENL
jgi:UDP-N-acetylglucosamine 2-epimerase (non-hydrolysing)